MRFAALLLLAGCSAAAPSAKDGGCPPEADRTCVLDAECSLLNVQVDCCGSEIARGAASTAVPAAEQAERICAAQWPSCRCLAKDPVADDGKPFSSGTAVKLRCANGRCESFVP